MPESNTAELHVMRNRSENAYARPPRPDTREEIIDTLSNLEDGQNLVVWYAPLSAFRSEDGTVSLLEDSNFHLSTEEFDRVFNDEPMLVRVDEVEVLSDEDDDDDVDDIDITCTDLDDPRVDFILMTRCCAGIHSIRTPSDLGPSTTTIDGPDFTFKVNKRRQYVHIEADIEAQEDCYEGSYFNVDQRITDRSQLVALRDALNAMLGDG